jgi:coenzyme F420 hydrogenase subunit beta
MPETNICTEVVARDLCSGCGVCAGICPQKTLSMRWNTYGEYVAVDQYNRCSKNCDLCLQVCPFSAQVANEDEIGKELFSDIPRIQHRLETGYYLHSYVGYSSIQNHRLDGASGGLATWTLETLMEKGCADYAVCVSSNPERDKLFQYVVCSTPEQIRSCAKSCYYPVELSEVIRHILSCDGRYAVVGLPCFIKSLRLAMQKNAILRRRIKYLLGLVCGQQKGKLFSEYVTALKGENPKNIFSVQFREKDPIRPASDYGLRYRCANEQGQHKEGTVFWTEGMGQAWCGRYFTLSACNYCDDIFAELADVVFMDAWLPEYKCDWRGTSIVLVRNSEIKELLEKGQAAKELALNPIEQEHVIQSQAGVVFNKRTLLGKRLTWAARNKRMEIQKRVPPMRLGLADTIALKLEDIVMRQSKTYFLDLRDQGFFCLEEFSKKMQKTAWCDKLIYRIIHKLIRIKQRIVR